MGGKGFDVTGAAASTQTKATSNFFKKMKGKAKIIAEREALQMAQTMHFILKNRFPLKGEPNSRYPKAKENSKFSHRAWKIQPRSNGEYWLVNDAMSKDGSYNYPRNLLSGKGWNTGGMGPYPNLVSKGTLLFSKQMPNGLFNWKKVKGKDFKFNVHQAFVKELL